MELRNEFKKNAQRPYEKRKKLFDCNRFEKIFHLNKKYLFLFVLILVFFMLNKKYFLFGAVTLLSSIFTFYHSKFNRTPMDFKFTLLFGLFITRYDGILFTLIFFVLSDVIASLLGGESIKGSDLFFFAWFFIVNLAVYLFPAVPLAILGPIIVAVEATGSFFINSTFGIPVVMSFVVSFLTIIVRIIYFLIFSGTLDVVFKTLG